LTAFFDAKNMADQTIITGTKSERKIFTEVIRHYDMAKEDLDARIHKFDTIDELFRSHIDESGWPYNAEVFDPRVFTTIIEKTSRLFANKPKGRLVPRDGGDALGAKINNEVIGIQWDEVSRLDAWPMLARWALMDMNARKYGASFALSKWHFEKRPIKNDGKMKNEIYFDGPDFRPLTNRDCLPNPSYSVIKNWFQHRDYLTLDEMQNVNDVARGKPVYKNLDLLRDVLKKENDNIEGKGGDTRASNYTSRNKSVKGLTDFLGQDEAFKVVEIVTEYRNNRWISFAPKHGVIVRDIPNPYKHGQIPVVMLKYYPIDDDLYGLSEIEPVEKLQKAINALINQYLDSVNMNLYTPLKIRTTGVQMHTLEFGPGAKWLMNDPATDVVPHASTGTGVGEFVSTYRTLLGAMQEALGETSAATSNLVPGQEGKTATEVRATERQKLSRDNFNQMFLSEAMKRQTMLWLSMNEQFFFDDPDEKVKLIRITGKEAIRYFQKRGLDGFGLDAEVIEQLVALDEEGEGENLDLDLNALQTPLFPVSGEEDSISKFQVEDGGEVGNLILEPEDISGNYDYIPDVESMEIPSDDKENALKGTLMELARDPNTITLLQNEGYKIKMKELLEDFFEDSGLKDAEKYFEKAEGGMNGQTQQGGEGIPQAGGEANAAVQQPGLAGGAQAVAGSQTA